MISFLSVLLLSAVTFAEVPVTGVELRESKITSYAAEKVRAGTIVTVNVVLKNTGDKAADGTDVRIGFPRAGFLVRIDELPELKRNDDDREFSARVDIPAGGEFRFSFDLLASRSRVGGELSSHIEVVYLLDQVRWNSDFAVQIGNAPSTAGIVIGGWRFHPSAGWMLGWMVGCGLMYGWMRARLRWIREHPKSPVVREDVRLMAPFGLVVLVMGPLAFLMVLGGMAWRDLQTLTSWKEAQATILDRREDVQGGELVRDRSSNQRGKYTRTGKTRTPEFALKYQAGEREVISSGFVTIPTVHVGAEGEIVGKAAMDAWVPGKTITCWYDPADPGIVVVRRGFGLSYIYFGLFFGLVPLVILWSGFRQLRKVSDAVRQLGESETKSA